MNKEKEEAASTTSSKTNKLSSKNGSLYTTCTPEDFGQYLKAKNLSKGRKKLRFDELTDVNSRFEAGEFDPEWQGLPEPGEIIEEVEI
jgi:hypothetical protein